MIKYMLDILIKSIIISFILPLLGMVFQISVVIYRYLSK
jgi:hypothetical protein